MLKFITFLLFLTLVITHKITVHNIYPHNRDCYSQGLYFINSTHIFESCGLYGKSYFHVLKYISNPFTV